MYFHKYNDETRKVCARRQSKETFLRKSSFHGEMAIKVCALYGTNNKGEHKVCFRKSEHLLLPALESLSGKQQLIRRTSLNPSVSNNSDDEVDDVNSRGK